MATIAEPDRTVYLETTIVSYLTARPSRDVVILGHQELTRQWWQEERESYRLVVSPVVLAEAKRGDPEAAEKRLRALSGIEILDPVPEVGGLAREVQSAMNIPEDFSPDAFHVAYAIHYEVDDLLTWNCAHIANAVSLGLLSRFCRQNGLWLPVVCTPLEILRERKEDPDERPNC